MRALADKELRELLPIAVYILAGATLLGAADCIYNWGYDHCLGLYLTLCLIAVYPLAFLAGANTLSRESRDNLTFLASWPVRWRWRSSRSWRRPSASCEGRCWRPGDGSCAASPGWWR